MPDSNSIRTMPASRGGEPVWTVITTPPGFGERWAGRAMAAEPRGTVLLLLVWLAFLIVDVVLAWNTGNRGWLFPRIILFAVIAAGTWERYAFGQLLARYDAELRHLQARPETR